MKEKIDSKESNILKNIKSKYILQHVFNYLQEIKLLNIIRYNKSIQKLLDKNINNYKESSIIEIEITFDELFFKAKALEDITEIKFINLPNENHLFHIYFNDNKEKIKRDYITGNDSANKIKIIIDNEIKSLKGLFQECKHIGKISFNKFYDRNINNMSFMFYGCESLKELNFYNIKANNVTDMSHMFHGCVSLKELNLSNFNTNNVIDMSYMFFVCSSLTKLNLENFNTNKVINMGNMFC